MAKMATVGKTGKPGVYSERSQALLLQVRNETRFYQCLYCEVRPIFEKPLNYVKHLLCECIVVKDNKNSLSHQEIIGYVIRLLIKERETRINLKPIKGNSRELCLLHNKVIYYMFPISKAIKCVCCSKKDYVVKIAIEHFFSVHLSTQSDGGDGLAVLITIEKLLCTVRNFAEELEMSYLSQDFRQPLGEQAETSPRTEYHMCLICNFRATSKNDIKILHARSCYGWFPKEQKLDSCWYSDCDICKKRILVLNMENHLIREHFTEHRNLRENIRNPLKAECVKSLKQLAL